MAFLCRLVLTILAISFGGFLVAAEPKGIPIEKLGKEFQILGKTHKPLGELVTLEGVVVDGKYKGSESGLNIKVMRINGQETREEIQIKLAPYHHSYDEKTLKVGDSCKLRGYEEMRCLGVPEEAYKEAGIQLQTCSFYFGTLFVVIKAKPTAERQSK
jgi:hypothetical protein